MEGAVHIKGGIPNEAGRGGANSTARHSCTYAAPAVALLSSLTCTWRMRTQDPHTGRETVREYVENDFIVIPARTPHMFEFLEDNCLLEWWADEFKAWYYTPYRSVIDRALPLADTARADFSIDVAEQRRGAPGGAGVAVLAQ
eukprot:365260-Chlamydomonas_euryale.AAC.2